MLSQRFLLSICCVDKHVFMQFLVSHFGYHFMRQMMASVIPVFLLVVTFRNMWVSTFYVLGGCMVEWTTFLITT